MESIIQQVRRNKGMTQQECASYLNIPLSTLRNWEQGLRQPTDWAVDLIVDKLLSSKMNAFDVVDENRGVLSYMTIKQALEKVLKNYDAKRAVLFGSYAKGIAEEYSDIDLFIDINIIGLDYFGLSERIREALHKRVDVITRNMIMEGSTVYREIQDTGVLVYER